MASNCYYTLMARCKSKESLQRFLVILQNKDFKLCLNKNYDSILVKKPDFSNFKNEEQTDIGTFYNCVVDGYMGWGLDWWLSDYPQEQKISNLQKICEILNIGVEIWGESVDMQFQQHVIVDHNNHVFFQQKEYNCNVDGFGDRYKDFEDHAIDVYNLPSDLWCDLKKIQKDLIEKRLKEKENSNGSSV